MRIAEIVLEELRVDPGLDFLSRSLYLWIVARQPSSVRQLAGDVGARWHSVQVACQRLAAVGWLRFEKTSRWHRPLPLIPLRIQTNMAEAFERDYAMAENKGEFLMKRLLDLFVHSDVFTDNARAPFLLNPSSGYQLEYDRFYHELRVAFEFNGSQHYHAAQGFGDRAGLKELEARDLIKDSLSRKAGINLIVVTPEQLRPAAFKALLPDGLPRCYVDEDGPCFKAVARLCIAYAEKTAREVAKAAGARA